MEVLVDNKAATLEGEGEGYFSGFSKTARVGSHYKYRLDGGDSFPDPASRFQADGPHGDSEVIDPSAFSWTDDEWAGVTDRRQVIYEMHVGTFTKEGTYTCATTRLGDLASLGVTILEVMPVAEFPGRFGWGYDGVDWYAPYHGYGRPDDFRAFIDAAHAAGIGVILDVVYNHFGPDGNYLKQFSDSYFRADRVTDWGEAINFDGQGCGPVRELVLANARHWITEFHIDGLRLDATDNIYDDSHPHIIEEIGVVAREAAGKRSIIILGENEAQRSRLVRDRARGGYGLDMLWNDDFHHTALIAAAGARRREAYLTDYRGSPQEFVSAIKHGFLYQGQHYDWQEQRRGTPALDVPFRRFVHFIENHDQVANSRDGRRIHQLTSPGRYRALTAMMLLGPQTPMLFQGQEFGSSAPFLYFADHRAELANRVKKGRLEFLAQFPSMAGAATQAALDDPAAPESFERSRLDWSERRHNTAHVALHHDLIALRRQDPVLAHDDVRVDGAVLGEAAFLIRFFAPGEYDRLLVVNLGTELALDIAPEPLLAPPDRDAGWVLRWCSEDARYEGRGASNPESEKGSWRIPAESATLLAGGQ